MNGKMSVFVICVEAIVYLLLYNLHGCTSCSHRKIWPVVNIMHETFPVNSWKNVKNTLGGGLLLVKLQVSAWNFIKSNSFFLNCTNGTKSPKASHTFDQQNVWIELIPRGVSIMKKLQCSLALAQVFSCEFCGIAGGYFWSYIFCLMVSQSSYLPKFLFIYLFIFLGGVGVCISWPPALDLAPVPDPDP